MPITCLPALRAIQNLVAVATREPQMSIFLSKDGLNRNLRIGVEPPFASFALQQTLFLRLEDGLAAIVNAKLLENVLDVTLDGPNGD
jgi:hypothetical protein